MRFHMLDRSLIQHLDKKFPSTLGDLIKRRRHLPLRHTDRYIAPTVTIEPRSHG